MAGYVFSVSKDRWDEVCSHCIANGFFTPNTPTVPEDDPRKRKFMTNILSAFYGDLVTMKPGDNIYFLSNRRLYGIGSASKIGSDCKYDNYKDSSALLPNASYGSADFLTTSTNTARWVVLFKPSPYFFTEGADMDDVLRYRPSAFKTLRAFQDVSFIKIDDEENRALKEYISLLNEGKYESITDASFYFDNAVHARLSSMDLSEYEMDITKALNNIDETDAVLSEMFIEASLLQSIYREENEELGHWDYLSQQLIASPFKPIAYIDKIDVFGYRYSTHYPDSLGLITKFLLVELKKEKVNKDTLKQVMQYVDWVCDEYASGDYSRIEAYVLGSGKTRNLKRTDFDDICQRSYIAKTHPATPLKWNDVKILKYEIANNKVVFSSLAMD